MVFVIIGQLICGIGVGLFVFSGLGPDPNSVFIEGFGFKLNITYGMSSMILNGLIALIVFFVDKSFIHFASITGTFLIGFTVDFILYLLGTVLKIDKSLFLVKALFTMSGGLVLAFGIAIYVYQRLGVAAFDAISEVISAKTKIKFSHVRRGMDLLMMCIGYLLGGTVGIGTVYLALTIGGEITFARNVLNMNTEVS